MPRHALALLMLSAPAAALWTAPRVPRGIARLRATSLRAATLAPDGIVADVAAAEVTAPAPDAPNRDSENALFACGPGVATWLAFQADGDATAAENVAEIRRIITEKGPQAPSFWAYHSARSLFFAVQAAAGLAASRARASREATEAGASALGWGVDAAVATRLLLEAVMTYEQDEQHQRDGAFRAPWDFEASLPSPARGLAGLHRQANPLYVLGQARRFVGEAVGTLARRERNLPADKSVWLRTGGGRLGYPAYYDTNFHFQTDGWMSSASAKVYETSTETLFVGRQDAMQRQTLAALAPWRDARAARGGAASARPPRVLEVACGTGRFLTFLRDNYADADVTAVDLSPFYLEAARENDAYWRKLRAPRAAPATFAQAAAEALPFEDAAFDAVVCVYLFHEMPREARAAAAAEMARVVAPGGVVVLTDSIQTGDRPALDGRLENFENLNEPHYADYLSDDLAAHFLASPELRPGRKEVASTTKTLSFTREL